jgi:hypothetical protein
LRVEIGEGRAVRDRWRDILPGFGGNRAAHSRATAMNGDDERSAAAAASLIN